MTELEGQVVGAVAAKRILSSRGLRSISVCSGSGTCCGSSGSHRSATELTRGLSGLSTRGYCVRIDVVALIAVDVIEITVLPWTGVDVEPYVHRVALMDIHLLQAVGTENTKEAGAGILILRLNDKLLRLPGIARALRDTFLSGIFLDNYSFNFYSL